jgi:hypothetical protein
MVTRRWVALLGVAVAATWVCVGSTLAQPPFVSNLTGFEEFEVGPVTGNVIWRDPLISGTTVRYNQGEPPGSSGIEPDGIFGYEPDPDLPWSVSQVVEWAHYEGSKSYEIYFDWGNPADTNAWPDPPDTGTNDFVRCTTFGANYFDRPSVHLGGKIKFRISVVAYDEDYFVEGNEVEASILLVAGIRETGSDLAQGETDTAGGDIEWVYPDGTLADGFIPPNTNGPLPLPPYPGGLRIHSINHWPPNPANNDDWQLVVIDLGDPEAIRGFANDSTPPETAGDGLLNAATWGVGDGVNRGSLESLSFTNDSTDTTGKFFFIYIDNVVLESPEPDPPVIRTPVTDADTNVLVDCTVGATEAELFIDDISAGTTVPDGNGLATFSPLTLTAGEILRARQTVANLVSGFSAAVMVTSATMPLAESFDAYASQTELEEVWGQTAPANELKFLLTTGSASSCENFVVSDYEAGAAVSRLYRDVGNVNGTDEAPLWVTYRFKHVGEPDPLYGSRMRFELTSSLTRAYGALGFAFTNGVGGQWATQYTSMTNSPIPVIEGYVSDYFNYDYALTGVERDPGVWHKMQIEVKTDVVNFYIDDQLANPITTNGDPIWPDGVPRVNNNDFRYVILGTGYSDNGPAMMYDDISITIGDTELPFGAPAPPAPTITGFLVPNLTTVSLDVDTNASLVEVFADGGPTPIGSQAGPFPTGTADVTVSALSAGAAITARQTIDGEPSCQSWPVIVADTSVVSEYEMGPTLLGLSRSISADDLINGQVGTLENGDVDLDHGVVAWNMNSGSACLEMMDTQPSPGFHAATPPGGLADLTDGVEGTMLEAVLADYNRASLVVRYDFPLPVDIEEIVVFAANEDPGATNNGRLFQHYDVYVSTNGMVSFQALARTVTSGGFGYLNRNDDRATFTHVFDAVSPILAGGVTNLRFVFYCVSNTAGRFHDPWQGNANEDAGYQTNCPDVEAEDTDGYRKAFEAPILKEIDVFGRLPGDSDGDGDVDLDDFANFAECLNGPDALPNPTPPPTPEECLDYFDFDGDSDVDLDDFEEFQVAFTG